MTQTLARLITLALLGAACGAAHADRPLVSETADVIERGACQVESAFGRSTTRGLPAVHDFGALYTCGTAWDTQPQIAYAQARAGGERVESVLLGAKTNFRPPAEGQPGFGVAYAVAGRQLPRASYRFEDVKLAGLVTVELAKGWLVHGNLGWSRSRSAARSTTTWSLGTETEGDLTFAADLFGDDRNKPSASAGVGYVFGRSFSANLAFAQQFDTPRVRQWSVGVKVAF